MSMPWRPPLGALIEGGLQDPLGQGRDQTALLRDRNELVRSDDPVLGVTPAHQDLGTDGLPGAGVDLWLGSAR